MSWILLYVFLVGSLSGYVRWSAGSMSLAYRGTVLFYCFTGGSLLVCPHEDIIFCSFARILGNYHCEKSYLSSPDCMVPIGESRIPYLDMRYMY